MKMLRGLTFLCLAVLILLSSCAARTELVYYVQDGKLMSADGDGTACVFDRAEVHSRIAQTGGVVYFFSGVDNAIYRYDGTEATAIAHLDAQPLSSGSFVPTAPASEYGVFLTIQGDEVWLLSPDGTAMTPLGVQEMFCWPADVAGHQLSCLRGQENDAGVLCTWPVWLQQVDLKTKTVTKTCLSDVLPDMHSGHYWADGGTVWTDGNTSGWETACIQQWDPDTGELLTEIPRWHEGNHIDFMAVHNGMLFYIDSCQLWVRMPNGATRQLLALPEGPQYDYVNFPPRLYFGETAMVVLYDTGAGKQMQYLLYPAE